MSADRFFPIAVGADYDLGDLDLTMIKKNAPASVPAKLHEVLKKSHYAVIANNRFVYFKTRVFGASARLFSHHKKVLGASATLGSGDTDGTIKISASDLREMVDPYDWTVREDFTNSALNDPIIAPALDKRCASIFEDGFELVLEPKFVETQTEGDQSGTGAQLSEAQQVAVGQIDTSTPEQPIALDVNMKPLDETITGIYQAHLEKIKTWIDEENVRLIDKMRTANKIRLVQGRNITLMFPPISQLGADKLPDVLKTLPYQDIKAPVVDTGLTWAIVAVRVELGKKKLIMPDEMIYVTNRDDGLRKDSAYWGSSILEPVITMSRILKRLLNHDAAKIAISAYNPKKVIQLMTRGSETEQRQQIKEFNTNLFSKNVDVLTVNAGTNVTTIPVAVETDSLTMLHNVIENHLITNLGVTKSMMMRELNMNRDIATVQEITYIKYTRKQDEMVIANAFENQLLNPLLAHLAGQTFAECPFKVCIKRIELEDTPSELQQQKLAEEANQNMTAQESLQNQKQMEIQMGNPKQPNAKNKVVGASRMIQRASDERELDLMAESIDTNKELVVELKKLNNST